MSGQPVRKTCAECGEVFFAVLQHTSSSAPTHCVPCRKKSGDIRWGF